MSVSCSRLRLGSTQHSTAGLTKTKADIAKKALFPTHFL